MGKPVNKQTRALWKGPAVLLPCTCNGNYRACSDNIRITSLVLQIDCTMVGQAFFQIPSQLTEEEQTLQRKYQKLKRKVILLCCHTCNTTVICVCILEKSATTAQNSKARAASSSTDKTCTRKWNRCQGGSKEVTKIWQDSCHQSSRQ